MRKSFVMLILSSFFPKAKGVSRSYVSPDRKLSVSFSRDFVVQILDGDLKIVNDAKDAETQTHNIYGDTRNTLGPSTSPEYKSPFIPNSYQNYIIPGHQMDALDNFVHRLRAFASNDFSDWQKFEESNKELRDDFVRLRNWINILKSRDKTLQKQLNFAERMLFSMESSVALINYFNFNSIQAKWHRNMIRLNVGTYMLFDTYGNPEPLTPLVIKRLNAFEFHLRHLEKLHGALLRPSRHLSHQFYTLFQETREILGLVVAYAPPNHENSAETSSGVY